jgi:hypothetical protein
MLAMEAALEQTLEGLGLASAGVIEPPKLVKAVPRFVFDLKAL